MKIFNKTKNILVSDDVFVCRTIDEKNRGMLAFQKVRPIYVEMWLGRCPVSYSEHATLGKKIKHIFRNTIQPIIDFPLLWCGVHTFGMKYPIDVVVFDEWGVVQVVRKNMKPNEMFFWNPKYRRVIELPIESKIEKGDVLEVS